jgi:transcriptional regulator GlxA family with amidase domain
VAVVVVGAVADLNRVIVRPLRALHVVEGAEVRSELAKRYLARNTLSASEVAYLLGFTEPPAFFKAFKRWTGMTPREFQQTAPL